MKKRTPPVWLSVALLLLVISAALTNNVVSSQQLNPDDSSESLKTDDLSAMTVKIASLSTQYRAGNSLEPEQSKDSIDELGKQRYEMLAEMIENDPEAFLRYALPQEVLNNLPDDVQGYFEKREEIEGELEVIAACEETDGRILYYLTTEKERFAVYFVKPPEEELLTGSVVRFSGILLGDLVVVDDADAKSGNFEVVDSVLPNTLGEQRVLVLLVNFQDDQRTPYTIDQANSMVFGTINNYYREASYGQTTISGDTRGWFTLPISTGSGYCLNSSGNQIATYARQAAVNAGINLSLYNKFMYVFPQISGCGYAGWASIGGADSWINNYLILRTTAHELGHNFGLYHAKALSCDAGVLGGTCTSTEYGHITDMMGSSGVTGHFHAFQKERMGWLNNGSMPTVATVSQSGNYFIAPTATSGADAKSLKILKSVDSYGRKTWYYVEVRRPFGFDSFVSSNSSVMNGVLVTMNQESTAYENYLLDMTPETTSRTDSALAVNRSYNDAAAAITITPLSVDSNGATVNVSFGIVPCISANPTISVTPSGTRWIGAGSSFSYWVTVTNNNGNSCTNSNFSVLPSMPAGWSAAAAAPILNIAPGASATTTVQVVSAAAALDGFYSIGIAAVNTAAPSYSASVALNCAVYSSLAVSVSASQTVYTRNQSADVTAAVSANGSPMAGANVVFTMTKPNGKNVVISAVTASNGSAVFSYRFNRKNDPVGTYFVDAAASLNGVSGNGSTNFEVR